MPRLGERVELETGFAIAVRPERPADVEAVEDLIARAFEGHPHSDGSEGRIVRGLRAAGALTLSLVAIDASGALVGHVAFSPVVLSDGSRDWYGLAPASVEPSRQRQGIGSALVRAGLSALREQGATGCVVLGDPAYYRRFGFALRSELVYPGGPSDHFQAIVFEGSLPSAIVAYHPVFDPSFDPADESASGEPSDPVFSPLAARASDRRGTGSS